MSKEQVIESLCLWLENGLLPKLSGNEAVALRQQIGEARKAAQQSVRADVCHLCGTKYAKRSQYCHHCGTRR